VTDLLLSSPDEAGWTPLHVAAAAGRARTVEILLAAGADAAAATPQGRTALHYAASKADPGVIAALLAGGCDASARDKWGATPLHRAASADRLAAVRALLAGGAKAGSIDARRQTPLHVAAAAGARGPALVLASLPGADVEAEDADEETALSLAAPHGGLRAGLAALAKGDAGLEELLGE
jgi:26S proteasome non-ATPase regulatory subunit 10